eukprot:365606-Chlamydomonas_euryale.AAC.8
MALCMCAGQEQDMAGGHSRVDGPHKCLPDDGSVHVCRAGTGHGRRTQSCSASYPPSRSAICPPIAFSNLPTHHIRQAARLTRLAICPSAAAIAGRRDQCGPRGDFCDRDAVQGSGTPVRTNAAGRPGCHPGRPGG